jgi:hypothetical protein
VCVGGCGSSKWFNTGEGWYDIQDNRGYCEFMIDEQFGMNSNYVIWSKDLSTILGK